MTEGRVRDTAVAIRAFCQTICERARIPSESSLPWPI